MDPNIRNLKDFLLLYNKVTEICFNRCVDNFHQRKLGDHEETCITLCLAKFARFNQNMMKAYVDVQTEINNKRMLEIEENQKKLQTEDADKKALATVDSKTPSSTGS